MFFIIFMFISQPTNPTSQPTSQPSSALLQGLVFDFTTKFSNIDLTDWNANANHLELYKHSLLTNIPNIRESDVTNIVVKDDSIRRKLAEISNGQLIIGNVVYDLTTRSLLSKGIEIVTTISVRPEYYNKSESLTFDDTYNQIIADIQSTSAYVLTDLQSQSSYFQYAVVSSVTFTSYSIRIMHSALPTSTPTSAPSCGAGYVGDNVNCVPCAPGFSLSDFNNDVCEPCPLDHYSNTYGSATCTACPSPYGAYKLGSTECTAYYLNYSGTRLKFLIGSFVFLFLFSMVCAGRRAFAVFAVMLFPAMDVTTGSHYLVLPRLFTHSIPLI